MELTPFLNVFDIAVAVLDGLANLLLVRVQVRGVRCLARLQMVGPRSYTSMSASIEPRCH